MKIQSYTPRTWKCNFLGFDISRRKKDKVLPMALAMTHTFSSFLQKISAPNVLHNLMYYNKFAKALSKAKFSRFGFFDWRIFDIFWLKKIPKIGHLATLKKLHFQVRGVYIPLAIEDAKLWLQYLHQLGFFIIQKACRHSSIKKSQFVTNLFVRVRGSD